MNDQFFSLTHKWSIYDITLEFCWFNFSLEPSTTIVKLRMVKRHKSTYHSIRIVLCLSKFDFQLDHNRGIFLYSLSSKMVDHCILMRFPCLWSKQFFPVALSLNWHGIFYWSCLKMSQPVLAMPWNYLLLNASMISLTLVWKVSNCFSAIWIMLNVLYGFDIGSGKYKSYHSIFVRLAFNESFS